MKSQAIFDAINQSQDNSPLRRWMLREKSHVLHWSFADALSALLVLAWRDADDAEELENDLFYAQQQIASALRAVQEETAEEVE